ncbi:MAG: lysophospholipid acyltransferase family protein [Chloroflexi bacterium]|nr:lysophospholipid acyltransferase family protein [Chloroflexota bacterium]
MRYIFYRLAAALCPHVPPRLGFWFFARMGDLAFLFSNRESTYIQNLRRVLGANTPTARVNAVARAGYQNLLKNYFDLFRGHAMTPAKLREQLPELRGFEHIENALKQGKGAIIGSAHFGAWDIIIQLAAIYLQARVVLPVERLKPAKLFEYVQKWRSSSGIDVIPLEHAPRAMIKALRAGEIVGVAFDRDILRNGPIVNFFGSPTQMSDGAVQLAFKFDAPVIVGFSIRRPDNRCAVVIEPPVKFEKTGDLQKDIQAGVQKVASVMERYIRQYPEQWLMFQKIWEK